MDDLELIQYILLGTGYNTSYLNTLGFTVMGSNPTVISMRKWGKIFAFQQGPD